jgi:hypothetical protein
MNGRADASPVIPGRAKREPGMTNEGFRAIRLKRDGTGCDPPTPA